uniref:Protein YIPF n=1 Tax=Ditylenchus dipsaci TaxID=166011 RepID=A0A915EFK7_9BILA
MANTNFSLDLDLLEKRDPSKRARPPWICSPTPKRPANGLPVEPSYDTDFDTLDEPVWDTINRDLKLVSGKFAQVLVPAKKEQNVLKNWDLWGPLFICVALSLILQGNASSKGPQFTQVFSLAFFGSCVVTMNINY